MRDLNPQPDVWKTPALPIELMSRCGGGNRTRDHLVMSQFIYQLIYSAIETIFNHHFSIVKHIKRSHEIIQTNKIMNKNDGLLTNGKHPLR